MKHQRYGVLLILACCASVALSTAADSAATDTTPISAERAAALAVNRLEPTANGVVLSYTSEIAYISVGTVVQ